ASVQIDDFIEETMRQASQQLYYILLLLCRQHPLTTIVNAGENEGFQAWRKLVEYYEPNDRLALFERELLRCEQRGGEAIAASMRIGIVLRQLEEGPLRHHLFLNATRLVEWRDFRREVTDIRRAQSAIAPVPLPMDLSAFTEGDGQGKSRGDGKGKGKSGGKGKSKGDSKGKSKSDGNGKTGSKLSPAMAISGASSRQVAALCLNDAGEQASYPLANPHSLIIYGPGPDKADAVDSAIGAALDLNMIHGNSDAEEVELNGILRVGIDSCAAASVLPRGSCADYPVHEGGQAISYKTSSGHYVNDEGERPLAGAMPGASLARAAKFRVAGASKPLLSVAEMVDSGHRLVFDSEGGQDISYAHHETSGDVVQFFRRNKVYEMDMHVDPYVPEVCPVEVAGHEPPEGEAGQPGAAHEQVAEGPPARPARCCTSPTGHGAGGASLASKGLSAGRQTNDHQESALAVVGIDCGCLGEREDATPLLIGRDSKQRWFHASAVPSKGAQHPWPQKSWSSRLASAGHQRFVFRSDGEAPLVALQTRIGAKLKQGHGVEAVPEESAVGDSQGNGLAEHAVREVKAKVRAARAQVDDFHGVSIGIEHPVTPWMVEFAAMSISLGRRGAGGRAAWELRRGRPFNKDLACFSEKVLHLPGGKRKAGIEVYIGTELGALRARAFERLTVEQRADKDLLNSLVGKPRAPVPTDMAVDEVPVTIEIRALVPAPVAPVGGPLAPIPEAEDLPPRAPRVGRPPAWPRAVYIRKDVGIAKYGIPPGCCGCAAILNGARAQAHSAGRRARIEQAMQGDEGAKQRLGARERKRHRTDVAGLVYQEGGSPGSGGPAPVQQAPPAHEAAAAADVATAPAPHDPGDENVQEEISALLLSLGYSGRKADAMEVFCQNSLVGSAPLVGLVHGGSFDLRVGWGLADRQQQRQCRELIEHYEDTEKQREAYAIGHEHLRFVIGPYTLQVKNDRALLHERSWSADSRGLDIVKDVMALSGVEVGRGDQRVFGLVVADARGDRLAKKPTRWMSNNKEVLTLSALDAGPKVDDEEISLKGSVGRWRDTLRTEFYDDLTSLPLDPTLVKAARRLEMDFMAQLGARFYAREEAQSTIAGGDIGAVFAATPPLVCLRLICSMAMSSDPSEGRVLCFLGISRAHPHCEIKSTVCIKLPGEDPMSQEIGTCGLLRMALYGARDAGQSFELTTAETVIGAGCDQSAFSPCVYCHRGLQVSFFHHGDDFALEGSRGGTESICESLKTKFIVKDGGVLGPAPTDAEEITRGEAIEYEADPWHAQILHAQLGMDPRATKSLSTPGLSQELAPEVERELNEHEAAEHRSACMRLGYLALVRPEVQFTAKECARGMQKPTERRLCLLKRAGRFLTGAPRAIWKWGR
ncbi:unnamed protein product, partial [Prorocentrum cordatum]